MEVYPNCFSGVPKTKMDLLRQRSYIYCPICGARITPVIDGGTDDTMNGIWTCDDPICDSTFNFELVEEARP